MAAVEEQFLVWYKEYGRILEKKYPTCTVACEAYKAAIKSMEAAATSHNKQSTPCDNPLHNTQVEADGRCHWCESKVLL